MARLFVLAVLACTVQAVVIEDNRAERRQIFRTTTDKNAAFMQQKEPNVEADDGELKSATSVLGTRSATGMKLQYPFYHTSEELKAEAERLVQQYPGCATIKTVSQNGVDIHVVTVEAKRANPTNRVFLLFGEHSRELISPESGLHFLKALCGEEKLESDVTSMAQVREDNSFQLVLNGNPGSRHQVELGQYCVRENPNGVDLNRNWDEKWQEATEASMADTNPGPKPFSEPETQIFKQLVTEFKPTTFLTVHSGTRGMYMPWAFDMEHLANRNQPAMMEILQKLDEKHCECPYGAAGKEVGYSCPGTCLDWVYDKMQTPFSFAFEIWVAPEEDEDLTQRWKAKMHSGGSSLLQDGSHLAHTHFAEFFRHHTSDFVQLTNKGRVAMWEAACFRNFNPDTKERYDETVKNWATVYLEMAHHVHQKLLSNSSSTP